MLFIVGVFIVPRALDIFIPQVHKDQRITDILPGVTLEPVHVNEGVVSEEDAYAYSDGRGDRVTPQESVEQEKRAL